MAAFCCYLHSWLRVEEGTYSTWLLRTLLRSFPLAMLLSSSTFCKLVLAHHHCGPKACSVSTTLTAVHSRFLQQQCGKSNLSMDNGVGSKDWLKDQVQLMTLAGLIIVLTLAQTASIKEKFDSKFDGLDMKIDGQERKIDGQDRRNWWCHCYQFKKEVSCLQDLYNRLARGLRTRMHMDISIKQRTLVADRFSP